MLFRAVRRRCPRCGGRPSWFTGWFRRVDRCRTCGYRYERQDGFMVGAITINTILTFGAILVVLVVGTIVTYPESAVVLAMHPLQPAEAADAARAVAARSAHSGDDSSQGT